METKPALDLKLVEEFVGVSHGNFERVKELLVYGEMSFSEIAWQMGYSSTQHLSNQFRHVTGLTPTQFKVEHRYHDRKPLDSL